MTNTYTLPNDITESVTIALKEDIGSGDVTASLIDEKTISDAYVICRDAAVISGIPYFEEVFNQVDKTITINWLVEEGSYVEAKTKLCEISGNARNILTAERAALNFLQLLSATATQTQQYVDLIKHTNTKILDTRKTIPGLRLAQKYAVLCGSGENHRIGLYDRVLIKENHILAAGSITAAVQTANKLYPNIKVEVETESLDEFKQASDAGADIIMLDNYSLKNMREAVNDNPKEIPLEASGGVSKDTVVAIAETGVDYISIGEITKNINAIDLSMRFI